MESNKQQIQEIGSKVQGETRKQRQLPKRVWIHLCMAPPSLSRDRRIKMKKSINQKVNDVIEGVELVV